MASGRVAAGEFAAPPCDLPLLAYPTVLINFPELGIPAADAGSVRGVSLPRYREAGPRIRVAPREPLGRSSGSRNSLARRRARLTPLQELATRHACALPPLGVDRILRQFSGAADTARVRAIVRRPVRGSVAPEHRDDCRGEETS
jgi:hypothetical protein